MIFILVALVIIIAVLNYNEGLEKAKKNNSDLFSKKMPSNIIAIPDTKKYPKYIHQVLIYDKEKDRIIIEVFNSELSNPYYMYGEHNISYGYGDNGFEGLDNSNNRYEWIGVL